jgi:hypothetical protein
MTAVSESGVIVLNDGCVGPRQVKRARGEISGKT